MRCLPGVNRASRWSRTNGALGKVRAVAENQTKFLTKLLTVKEIRKVPVPKLYAWKHGITSHKRMCLECLFIRCNTEKFHQRSAWSSSGGWEIWILAVVHSSSYDPRIIQAGRDLTKSLVQPPAQSRVSSAVTPGCSGLYPVRAWKWPKLEAAHPLSATCSPSQLLSQWKNSS